LSVVYRVVTVKVRHCHQHFITACSWLHCCQWFGSVVFYSWAAQYC